MSILPRPGVRALIGHGKCNRGRAFGQIIRKPVLYPLQNRWVTSDSIVAIMITIAKISLLNAGVVVCARPLFK
jgi:hypothetical protein